MTEKKGSILVIDDDRDVLVTARMILKKQFEKIDALDNPEELRKLKKIGGYDLILLDMNFSPGATSGEEGLFWLRYIQQAEPEAVVIMITAYGGIDLAVKAVKTGAVDFIVKPWDNKRFLATIESGIRLARSRNELRQVKSAKDTLARDLDHQYTEIIGNSAPIQQLHKTIQKVSGTDVNILILGENGTGKELVAREIHRRSQRAEEVFMNVDLGALSENLFESELFGHVKGAFTDAKEDRLGRFEMASGGSLFLDEIGNLSFPLQSKLLTAIQRREINRVGSSDHIPVDVRLICATNMPVKKMVAEDKFRQDLLYRINTVEIQIPPLRERAEDIPELAEYFFKQFKAKYRKNDLVLSANSLKELQNYRWPGNVRELQHILERAVIMAESKEIRPKEFILDTKQDQQTNSKSLNLEEVEKQTILTALKKHSYNLSAAAKELGLGRTTLYRKMSKYEL